MKGRAMMGAMADFKVRIVNSYTVEFRRGESTVRFKANLRDRELYVGEHEVTGPALPRPEIEEAIGRVYDHLNRKRQMGVDFLRPDGSPWGEPQGWQAKAATPEEIARLNRPGFFRRLLGR